MGVWLVERLDSCISISPNFFDLRRFLQPANISIKITTIEESATDSINDQDNDQDMDKTDVCRSEFLSSGQITNFSYFQTTTSSNAQVLEDKSRVV